LASKGEAGSGADGELSRPPPDDLLPNKAENGNRPGVSALLDAAGGGATPVLGKGAGTGSGTFSAAAGAAKAIAPMTAATMLPQIAAPQPCEPAGATLVEPVFAGRCAPISPLPPIRVVRRLSRQNS
jgi:hypothetical protein